jgi:hypothetical protein
MERDNINTSILSAPECHKMALGQKRFRNYDVEKTRQVHMENIKANLIHEIT